MGGRGGGEGGWRGVGWGGGGGWGWGGGFFFNDTATTEIYTLSLHDALPIFNVGVSFPYAGHSMLLSGRIIIMTD